MRGIRPIAVGQKCASASTSPLLVTPGTTTTCLWNAFGMQVYVTRFTYTTRSLARCYRI